jgi:hypothetical protein
VHVEGDDYETNMCCAPLEFHLFRDLKNQNHGFKCDDFGLQPSIAERCASPDLPMVVSFTTNDASAIRPGNTIFAKAFSMTQLHVDLPLCLKFVLEHGSLRASPALRFTNSCAALAFFAGLPWGLFDNWRHTC